MKAPASKIFEVMADAKGLEKWWTKKSSGKPEVGSKYELDFGPGYIWQAAVSKYEPGKKFELTMGTSDPDWEGTRVGFEVEEKKGNSQVRFYHTGWSSANEHYRISTYCWAMYLRLAKRYAEKGETVPNEKRLDA
ncbi:MAG TPA: SRPBCC domain-containing protein [Puia sp.]|nr:SRPBCC domain-containing protein [Puia sp.]